MYLIYIHLKVFGYNIHPEESSICKAAIIDNAMPLIGGVVGIGIGVGLEKYPSGEPVIFTYLLS